MQLLERAEQDGDEDNLIRLRRRLSWSRPRERRASLTEVRRGAYRSVGRRGLRTLAGVSTGVGDEEHRSRALLEELIDRARTGLAISELLATGVDVDLVTDKLRPLGRAGAVIESIAGGDERIDAVVTAMGTEARVVFARSSAGVVSWLDVYLRPERFDGVSGGRLIVVNGPSGAGKSTLMRALQSVATFPLVVLDEPEHIGTVQPGYLIWRDRAPSLHRGYLAAVATLARAGNHVAVSAAGHRFHELMGTFEGVPAVTVGLTCEFQVLQERERRTGRWAGIAAASVGVHDGWIYDLEFDTTDGPDPLELARVVLDRVMS